MSKYVAEQGYAGTAYSQSVVWHYKTDIDRDVLNRWFVNIFDQGVLKYTPSPDISGGDAPAVGPTILAGTSFLIKEKDAVDPDAKIAKVDMVLDYVLPLHLDGAALALIAQWVNAADEYRGVEFSICSPAELALVTGNYVRFGTVEIFGGEVVSNTTDFQTQASMASGLNGWSGYSGEIGPQGISGYSGDPAALQGYSGESGYSGEPGPGAGTSGFSGYSGTSGFSGRSGYSGYSSVYPGISGYSGRSGFSGLTGSECILITCSDESTPLTGGYKTIFRMPYAMILSRVKASLTYVGLTQTLIDVRYEAIYPGSVGSSIFSAPLKIDVNSKTATAVAGADLSITTLPNDSEIIVNIVTPKPTGAAGLKLYLIGNKA